MILSNLFPAEVVNYLYRWSILSTKSRQKNKEKGFFNGYIFEKIKKKYKNIVSAKIT